MDREETAIKPDNCVKNALADAKKGVPEGGAGSKTEVAAENDTRNLRDQFKGLENNEVFIHLSKNRSSLEVAIENVGHDFNIGTVVRNANNFNVSKVHIIGRKKYNRRGAMCTDKYLEICHWESVAEFLKSQKNRELVAIENNIPPEILESVYKNDSNLAKTGVKSLMLKNFVQNTTLVFGSESDGISAELLKSCQDIREIPDFGSTRSVNVGVASGIAMYEWAPV